MALCFTRIDSSTGIFNQAASHDNALAQYMLGVMYATGYGVSEDLSKAWIFTLKLQRMVLSRRNTI